jgi:hypothetical protein
MRPIIALAAAVAALTIAAPACAQGYVVVDAKPVLDIVHGSANAPERACMSGKAPSSADIEAAHAAATETMQRYLHLAAGAAPANAIPAFSFDAAHREWWHNDSQGTPSAVDDPLARTLAARGYALPEAVSFNRSSDTFGALAIWRIAGEGDGVALGYYRVFFRQEGLHWNIQRLEVIDGTEPERAHQFCHLPGDLTPGEVVREVSSAEIREGRKQARRESVVEGQLVRDHKQARHDAELDKDQRLTAIAGGKGADHRMPVATSAS